MKQNSKFIIYFTVYYFCIVNVGCGSRYCVFSKCMPDDDTDNGRFHTARHDIWAFGFIFAKVGAHRAYEKVG